MGRTRPRINANAGETGGGVQKERATMKNASFDESNESPRLLRTR